MGGLCFSGPRCLTKSFSLQDSPVHHPSVPHPTSWICPLAAPTGAISFLLPKQERFTRWFYGFLCSWFPLVVNPITFWVLLTAAEKDFMPLGNKSSLWLGLLSCCHSQSNWKHNKWIITFYLHLKLLSFFLPSYKLAPKPHSACIFCHHVYSYSQLIFIENWLYISHVYKYYFNCVPG